MVETDREALREIEALRAWRRENGLPEVANPPLHWSDTQIEPLHHSYGRAVAVAEYSARMFADLTQEIIRVLLKEAGRGS